MARRRFEMADQQQFARLSGDWNPIHVDPVAARRTVAGTPVVHGVHLLLWALDAVATDGPSRGRIKIHVQFLRFVHLGDEICARSLPPSGDKVRLQLVAGETVCCTIDLRKDPAAAGLADGGVTGGEDPIAPETPWDSASDDGHEVSGRIALSSPATGLEPHFPAAARWLGGQCLAELAATTRLVGMAYPGLHSIFTGLRLALAPTTQVASSLGFHLNPVRHGLFRIDVAGQAVSGRLEALRRQAPVAQPGMAEVRRYVAPGSFAGTKALIVGGSRGLGELAAKMLATGGADITLTYYLGRGDAERVVAAIHASGAEARAIRYDATAAADEQLAQSDEAFTHIYYFAAPPIARPNSAFFDNIRFEQLRSVFIDGFYRLALACHRRDRPVRMFYPSTSFIDERPKAMAEYAMIKAAGEVLCREIEATMRGIAVVSRRLPPLPTDQTAGVGGLAQAERTMLQVLDAMRGGG